MSKPVKWTIRRLRPKERLEVEIREAVETFRFNRKVSRARALMEAHKAWCKVAGNKETDNE